MNEIERRSIGGTVEIRTVDGGKRVVRGYAAPYGKRSENLGSEKRPIFEVIEPGFFDEVMNDDVRALFNHDPNGILARCRAGKGTLRLFSDDTGLGYEFDLPDTRAGQDLAVSLARGDIDGASFGFQVKKGGDKWKEENGVITRTLKKGGCARLLDVSPVTYPAYPDTEATLRSADQFLKAEQPVTKPVAAKETTNSNPLGLWEKRLASVQR